MNGVVYVRSQYVAEWTKRRADGRCELCRKPAPFKNTSSNEPYLESHHIVWLSRGGLDCTSNTVALCPNCHRKMHVVNAEKDIKKLTRLASAGAPRQS
ncbi:MAG: HNH endonuclease [Candidatus Dadabacteria bacterium]|nr:HNH endonuclease [Candidatus Dadabacteria bacterium]